LNNDLRAGLLSLAMLALPAVFSSAQSSETQSSQQGLPQDDELYKTIKRLDTELFEAYNTCKLDKLGSMVAEDLEFYHDQTGLSVGRQALVDAVKNNICGKVHRELVEGTLEVYPLKDYGAVEIGVHRFTHPDQPGDKGGDAKFIHLWRLKDGAWQVTRVISFDHNHLAR
jgi:hypothetical protein